MIDFKGVIIKIDGIRVDTTLNIKGITLQEWSLLVAEMERVKHDLMAFDVEPDYLITEGDD